MPAAGAGAGCTFALVSDHSTRGSIARAGGRGKPRIGQVTVCWADSEDKAKQIAHEWWPNSALPGQLSQELPMPSHFEQAVELVGEDEVAERIVCGPDVARHVAGVQEFVDAGCDQVYVHQVGPVQDGFFDFYERDVIPPRTFERLGRG